MADDGGGDPARGPYDPDAEMRPDLMRVEPPRATPGQKVALLFPRETPRGVAFVLERGVEKRWSFRSYLTAGDGWGPADEDYAWSGVGVIGAGPDAIMVPEPAEPGRYRVCTANAHPRQFCAELEVTPADT